QASSSQQQESRASVWAGSQLGSLQGNVSITAGGAYEQQGGTVSALSGNVDIEARSLAFTPLTDTQSGQWQSESRQSGVTVGLSNPVLSPLQTGYQALQAGQRTDDSRMQALAAGTAVLSGYQALQTGQS